MNIRIELPEEYFRAVITAAQEGLDARQEELYAIDGRRDCEDLADDLRDAIIHEQHCLDKLIESVDAQTKNEEEEDRQARGEKV